jgi:Mg2+ and Co2+ transporter CorA
MSLKTEIDNFAETYAEFLQLIEKDCRVIEHTLNKQKTAK